MRLGSTFRNSQNRPQPHDRLAEPPSALGLDLRAGVNTGQMEPDYRSVTCCLLGLRTPA